MLAAEYQTLPERMREAVVTFFEDNEAWLATVLEDGRNGGVLHFTGPAIEAARIIVSALEGALLVARLHGDPSQFTATAGRLLAGVAGTRDRALDGTRSRQARRGD